jgi:guanylate kinase
MKKIVVVVGPSGCGKSTVALALRQFGLYEAVSVTSRASRPGELTEGPDRAYTFLTREEFEAALAANELTEYTEFGGNYYGAQLSELISHPKTVIVVEPNGLRQIEAFFKDSLDVELISVYLDISDEVRKARMINRGDSEASIASRSNSDSTLIYMAKDRKFDLVINTERRSVDVIVRTIVTYGNF